MRCYEFMARTKKVLDVQPNAVQQQARVAQVVDRIAASDQHKQPTEMDKVLAMRSYAEMKRQAKRRYIDALRIRLAAADASNSA